jgi:FtsH-binding integral membrane protein
VPATLAAALDLLALVVFAAAGKRSHAEHGGLGEVLVIVWPFAAGAAVGWAAHFAIRHTPPVTPVAGVWVAGGALVVGHLLRVVTGRGTAPSFVVVSAVVLLVLLVGWRWVAGLVRRRG